MLNKELLVKFVKPLKEKNIGLFIIKDDNKIKLIAYKGFTEDFLKEYNYSYDNNLIVGTTPDSIIIYDNIIYRGYEMSINHFIEYFNEDHKGYILEV